MVNVNVKVNTGTVDLSSLADKITHMSAGNPNIGQLRLAIVDSVDLRLGKVKLYIISDKAYDVLVDYPGFMTTPDGESGLWYGLRRGDLVLCGIGYGNTYYIINKIGNSNSLEQSGVLSDGDILKDVFDNPSSSPPQAVFQDLRPGAFLLKSGNSKIRLSDEFGIFIGNLGYGSINFDIDEANSKRYNFTSLVSNQFFNITNSGYATNSTVLRDKTSNTTGDASKYLDPRYYLNSWYKDLKQIAFDPSLIISDQTRGTNYRNPALIEKREVTYEFSDDFFIESDAKEETKLTDPGKGGRTYINDPLASRRVRKNDCFSLSLLSPNYLIEKIEGTAVDINGNILDLNRNVLPVGNVNIGTTLTNNGYLKLRELHRRGLAFHWELNARKDPTTIKPETGSGNSYAESSDPYKRNRSRLFLDIDKEGQFKLNIPCSSEVGNVGVLARYENYTTINPYQKDNESEPNYDYYLKNEDSKTDILLDTYGWGVATPTGNDKLTAKNRTDNTTISVGTAFHDISKTCIYPVELNPDLTIKSQTDTDNQFRTGILYGPDYYVMDLDKTNRKILKNTPLDSIVTKSIKIDNSNGSANAGGRSGTAVFDGMLNISIGANTVDRQSLWLDLQGGIVQRIGCDKNGISNATQTDGDFYLQIGGSPYITDPDPRFDTSIAGNENIVIPNSNKTNVCEIRVIQGNGQYSRILIDGKGIVVSSPKTIELRSDEDILMYAAGSIRMSGEVVQTHVDDVKNDLAVPIHRTSRDPEIAYESDPGGGIITPKPFFGSPSVTIT